MNNTFTPEEANKPVTYGELLTILTSLNQELSKYSIDYTDTLQKHTFKIIDKLTEHIVAIRDDAEYKRQRDMHFMLGLFAQFHLCDKEVLHKEYKRWCEEFDELNKPQSKSE